MNYASKKQLVDEINKTAQLFIEEFSVISNDQKDTRVEGVDRTPAQMIAYQLGWLRLVKSWDDLELAGQTPVLPAEGYKWNRLGELYQTFYDTYQTHDLSTLISLFNEEIKVWNHWLGSLTEETLFTKDARQWTKPYPKNWTVARFVHINSVAPFKTFRSKIRKWKKLTAQH